MVLALQAKQYGTRSGIQTKRNSRCLIEPNSWGRRYWDLFIIVTAIYSTITSPMQIAWDPFGTWYIVVDSIIFACYLIDIGVSLRTKYTDVLGEEIDDTKKIAKNYLLSL